MMNLDELKCVSMVHGEQYVMITGTTMMLVLCVDSWDSLLMVSLSLAIVAIC